jgi:signal transduction histidine kinase
MLAETVSEFILRVGLAVVVVALGVVLIRNIRANEQRRLQLQKLTGELAKANKKLEQREETRSEFISIASHQLRTPVSVMKGYLSLMIDGTYGKVSNKILNRLEQMYEMNERLVLLINNMLNMARIEKNRIDFGFSELDIVQVADQVVNELTYKAEKKKLELRIKRPARKVPTVVSDTEKLKEILVNLIDNAIKYTVEGHIEVSFRSDRKNGRVITFVRDTGLGMSDEEVVKVFEKYYRIHNPKIPKESGTGLGLYIVTKFLKGMGGEIWVEKTAQGEGTTFAFSIPYKPPTDRGGGRKPDLSIR